MTRRAWLADIVPDASRRMWREAAEAAEIALTFAGDGPPPADSQVILARRVAIGEDVFAACPSARLIQWVGRFPVLADDAAIRDAGAALQTWPLISRITVAEHVFALILSEFRHIVPGDAGVRGGLYRERGSTPQTTDELHIAWNWLDLPVRELTGRTIGLIGAGEIALEVAERARCFGMRVLYTNRRRLPAAWELRLGVGYRELRDLAAESDVLSLHVPHTPDTVGLISQDTLSAMPDGALLVNTARGAVVDEAALLAELARGRLRAALDVFRQEPLPADDPLLRAPGTTFSPHVGGGCAGGLPADVARLFRHLATRGWPSERSGSATSNRLN